MNTAERICVRACWGWPVIKRGGGGGGAGLHPSAQLFRGDVLGRSPMPSLGLIILFVGKQLPLPPPLVPLL